LARPLVAYLDHMLLVCLSLYSDLIQGAILRKWLNHMVMPAFADRILPVDVMVVQRCAQLHLIGPKSDRDALIAATALVHGMTVVARKDPDFADTGVGICNPWKMLFT